MNERIEQLLMSTDRAGIGNLITDLNRKGFFISPASTKYHGAYKGGLLKHSMSVYNLFSEMTYKFRVPLTINSVILCSLLHDVCKAGAYIENGPGYVYNKSHPKGHAALSLKIIKKHISISEIEEKIIQYHMGMYGCDEFTEYGEYSLSELTAVWNVCKAAKLFYFCDDMSTQFLEKEKNEAQKVIQT